MNRPPYWHHGSLSAQLQDGFADHAPLYLIVAALCLFLLLIRTNRALACEPAEDALEALMNSLVVVIAVAAIVFLFVTTEVMAAVLPIVVVVILVPHEERAALAELIAVTDSSRKFRLWAALRLAVTAHRLRRARQDQARGEALVSGRSPDSPRR